MCYKQDSYISSTLDLVLKFKQKKQPNNFSYSPPSHQSQLGFSPCFSLTSTAGKKVHNIVLKYIINATLPRKTEVADCNLNNKAQWSKPTSSLNKTSSFDSSNISFLF